MGRERKSRTESMERGRAREKDQTISRERDQSERAWKDTGRVTEREREREREY